MQEEQGIKGGPGPVEILAGHTTLSPERMQALLASSWDILTLLDEEGRLVYNSPAAQRLHGFEPEEMAGRETFDFFHPEDAPQVGKIFQECLAHPGEPFRVQYRYARRDGSWIWMEAVAVNLLNAPSVRAIVVNSRDISERKAHEDELNRLNRLYDMLCRLGQSLVNIQTREGLFQEVCNIVAERGGFRLAWIGWVNPATHQVLPVAKAGVSVGYLDGVSISTDASRPDGQGPTGICIREDRHYICQDFFNDPATVTWRAKAAAFDLHSSASFPIHLQGQVVGALMVYAKEAGVFQDSDVALLEEAAAHISFGLNHLASEEQRRKLEAGMAQAQKLESLGSLAGGVAHDMNNVLGAILGLASANLEIQPAGTPAYRAFETIAKAAVRGGKMVQGLLSFARQSAAESRELDMNRLLREEVHLLEHTTLAKIHLELKLAEDLLPMRGDASALTHALMNLCVNAVDAMSAQGTLTLKTRNIDQNWIEVQIEDTGSGMSAEVMEKALDPFFTTKEHGKGTGLGLSIVYSTVKAHRGQMEIDSQPGCGTRVRLRFPACRPDKPEIESTSGTSGQASAQALDVLLVDDDELIQNSMEAALGVLGHAITVTSRGEEALSKLEAGLSCDAIILDLNMPGIGGAETLPRIRQLRPSVPILLASGRIDQIALELVKAHPFVTLLPKPFDMKELRRQLEDIERR